MHTESKYRKIYRELTGKGEDLESGPPSWVISANHITTTLGGYDYNISLDKLKTRNDVLMWVRQLSQKSWMTKKALNEFAHLLLSLPTAAASTGLRE